MKNNLRKAGIIISCLLGLEVEAVFYYVFGINPVYVPLAAVLGLWVAITLIIGCVVDEYMRRKYKVRLVRVRR